MAIQRPWTLQDQIDAYQSQKARRFWSKFFLFGLAAIVAVLILSVWWDEIMISLGAPAQFYLKK